MRAFTRLAAFYTQGLLIFVPIFIIGGLGTIVGSGVDWLIAALSAVMSVIYLLFAFTQKPISLVRIMTRLASITVLRLTAATAGLVTASIVIDSFFESVQAPLVVIYSISICLFIVALVIAMSETDKH